MGGDEGVSDGENVDESNEISSEVNILRAPATPNDEMTIESIEEFDASLPETVTLLRGPNGSKLYLIGTAHFSLESQDDVSKVIQTVNPHIVVVELCKSRANILKMDEKTIEEEARNLSFEKMMNIIKEEGTLQGSLSILLLNMSAQLTRDLGMAPGGEFRRAFIECQKLERRPLFHFGDRPIHVTIRRALEVLSWWQRIRLSFSLVFQKPKVSREDVEKCKQSDLLESMLKDLGNEFPELGKVLIEERDMYLTYSLQLACNILFQNPKKEIEPTIAVGVVGIGHTPGIKTLWGKVEEHQIPPIMTLKENNSKGRGIVRKIIIGGVLTYVALKIVRRFPPNPRMFGFKL